VKLFAKPGVVLLHRKRKRVSIVRERDRARAIAGADDGLRVHAPGHAGARPEVLEIVLNVHRVGRTPVAGDANRVGRRLVIGERPGPFDALERLIELPPQTQVEREVRTDLPLVLDEGGDRPVAGARLVDDLEVALHGARPVEQERREQFAMPVSDADSDGDQCGR
jgi:hypothetical protein